MEIRTHDGAHRLDVAQAERLVRQDERARLAAQGTTTVPQPAEVQLLHAALTLLPAGHPVAPIAGEACRAFDHATPPHGQGVACGRCWEYAIRCDERVVVEFGLTKDDEKPDPSYVDEIAVARFMDGESLPLGEPERWEVTRRMRAQGHGPWAISDRLGESSQAVRRRLDALAGRAQGSTPVVGVTDEAAQVA
ncbi:hypothetical protein [Pseudonocardia sp. H11422]|uniref:hypothetical protein n=1 Tax=Pseudonocardia sp. H11422 TaxID=2835866 RepID=UPI001BDBC4DB|nr:hypothetical protein [Pseudonocardia sp. H11422]